MLFNRRFDVRHFTDATIFLGIFYDCQHPHHLGNGVVQLIADIDPRFGCLRIFSAEDVKPAFVTLRMHQIGQDASLWISLLV